MATPSVSTDCCWKQEWQSLPFSFRRVSFHSQQNLTQTYSRVSKIIPFQLEAHPCHQLFMCLYCFFQEIAISWRQLKKEYNFSQNKCITYISLPERDETRVTAQIRPANIGWNLTKEFWLNEIFLFKMNQKHYIRKWISQQVFLFFKSTNGKPREEEI